MKKKNGFVFIEAIVTIVFLATALLLLFNSYQNAITDEKTKIYYDDIGYLYRNYYLADFLINKTEIIKKQNENFSDIYTMNIKEIVDKNDNSKLYSSFQEDQNYPDELKSILKEFNVNNMVVVSNEIITDCYNDNSSKCTDSYKNLDEDLTNYIKTMKIDLPEADKEKKVEYYLVAEYREKSSEEGVESCGNEEENCSSFYVTLKLDITKEYSGKDTIADICKGQKFGRCIEDNYDIENDENGGIYHHDGDPTDSNSDKEANDDSYRYAGGNPNNYICFGANECSATKNVDNLYRIIGVFDGSLKLIQADSRGSSAWYDYNDISASWVNSTLNRRQLNMFYLDELSLDDWKQMIISSKWNVGELASSELASNAQAIHNLEVKDTLDNKVGLITVSDYMYGAPPSFWQYGANSNYYNDAKNKNWLNNNQAEWLISKIKNTTLTANITSNGKVGTYTVSSALGVRPTVTLASTVILGGGKGTKEEPYLIVNAKPYIITADYNATTSSITTKDVNIVGAGEYDSAHNTYSNVKSYYFRLDNGSWQKGTSTKYTFNNLKDGTDYTIYMKVISKNGYESDVYELSCETTYLEPTVSLSLDTEGDTTISVKATATKGSSDISKFEYSTDNSTWLPAQNSNNPNSYTFTSLTVNKKYTLYVRVTDAKGHTATSQVNGETKYVEPIVTLTSTSSSSSSITVRATGTSGTGNITSFQYSTNNSTWLNGYNASNPNSYTFYNLSSGRSYTLYVRVTDEKGHTATASTTASTDYVDPRVVLVLGTADSTSITVKAEGTNGSNEITKYEYSTNNITWSSASNSNNPNTYKFNNVPDTQTLYVRVTDSAGHTGQDSVTYTNPTVNSVSVTSTTANSITVSINATQGLYRISKYYCSNNNGNTYTESSTSSCTMYNLSANSSYNIRVYAEDSNGRKSNYGTTNATTSYIYPEVSITSTSSTSNSITVNVTGYNGSANVSSYYFELDDNNWWYVNSQTVSGSAGSKTYTFTGLSPATNYHVQVAVYDTNSYSSYYVSADVRTADDKVNWPALHTINGSTAVVTKDGYTDSSGHTWEIISIGVKNIVKTGSTVSFDYGIRFENPDGVKWNNTTYTGQHVGNAMAVIYNGSVYYAHKGGSGCGTSALEAQNYYGTVYYATSTTKEDHKGDCYIKDTSVQWKHNVCSDNPTYSNQTPFHYSGSISSYTTSVQVTVGVSWAMCNITTAKTYVTFNVPIN